MRRALGVVGVAFLIHLIPLFLPRNMPEQELAIARVTPNVQQRVAVLVPLKGNEKATGAELREAAELLLEGAPAEARELVDEADRREPGAVETQLLRARICQVERMDRCVQETLERAARMAPDDARPDLLRAELSERSGNLPAALEAIAQAQSKQPQDTAVSLRYARLLSVTARHDEAEAILRGLEPRLSPRDWLLQMGMLRTRAGQDREARAFFARAVGEEPQSALAHYHLGMSHFQLGDMDAAEEELRTADRLDVSNPDPLAALCALQVRAARLEDARITRMDLERRFQDRPELIRSACRMDR
ncbi:tetratricopeptide repeat protein [Stigmatella aurantiaca]|uniref:TPR domain protein, putative n=1 Tax=Stigmatella aurantiaca (strain DW4/3-1) TaxID=378806 RepID=Q08UU0_STIAD|nr:tetratricopeptide repeat protein [Stigmatella aurantiaca]ADO68276.1 Tetratricopeptide repeat protein [Stigmatella aurantiaca DW4/3-1]EAU64262.1 TPR domain protein, putative [Stigmatella aurantiaca DW4/3-1]